MPDPIRLNLATLGHIVPPTNPGPGWVGPERPAESWADVKADPLSALFDLGRGVVTGDAPAGMNLQGLGALIAAAMPVAQGAKALRAATKAAKLSNLAEEAQQGIRGFHGSPHDWPAERLIQHPNGTTEYIVGTPEAIPDVPKGATVLKDFPLGRMRNDKIGTGEGAQAYGHGGYIAQREGVAEEYQKALGNRLFKVGNRELVSPLGGSTRAMDTQTRGENIAAQALDDAINAQSSSPAQYAANQLRKQAKQFPEDAAHVDEALKLIAQWQESGSTQKMGGKMYEVQIHASPDQFLDWDKPLSQQKDKVDAVLRSMGKTREQLKAEADRAESLAEQALQDGVDSPAGIAFEQHMRSPEYRLGRALADAEKPPNTWGYSPADKTTGKEIVSGLGPSHPEILRKAGIPGIRYLDGGSRAGGEGTRNFVIFDDSLVSILKKYGIALPIIEGLRERAKQGGGVVPTTDVHSLLQ